MKKLVFAIALAVSMFASANAFAQGGIIAGFTSSSTNLKEIDTKAVNLYHVGFVSKIDLGLGFAVQPGIIYQVKGANFGDIKESGSATKDQFEIKSGFVEVPVGLQWGPDLLMFRPYIFAEPFVGYQITSADEALGNDASMDSIKSWASDAKNRIEYGFGLGAGIEFAGHFQLSAQYFNNLGNLFSEGKLDGAAIQDNVKEAVKEGNFKGVKISLAILF